MSHNETADAKLLRVRQVCDDLAEYDDRTMPLDPDEADRIVDLVREWAGLAEIWHQIDDGAREVQWANSVFPPLLSAARKELTLTANWIHKNHDRLISEEREWYENRGWSMENAPWVATRLSEKSKRMKDRVAAARDAAGFDGSAEDSDALVLVSGAYHPEAIWTSIIRTAFAAKADPGYLTEARVLTMRGDLLLMVAEINRAMFLAVRQLAQAKLDEEGKQAKAAKAGGMARAIDTVQDERWKAAALVLRGKHPEWKKSDINRQVAKDSGGSENTIRKREWWSEVMKSDPSSG